MESCVFPLAFSNGISYPFCVLRKGSEVTMPLEIRRKHDGSLKSKYWYGAYAVNGKRHVSNLGVEIAGVPPVSLRDFGDAAFERSRGEAKKELEKTVAQARGAKSAEALVQELHEIKYGAKIQAYPVADLVVAWERMPKRRRQLNPGYMKDVKRTVQRFVTFVADHFPEVVDAAQVDKRIAREFMEAEEALGKADKTWNDTLKRVRATFKFLQAEYGLWRNPFDGIRMREEHQIHRKPLDEAQINGLLAAAADSDFCRPLIVCGLGTAMRLGDCCRLLWSAVNLESSTPNITVKTGKTGETVCIPVYDRLRAELELAGKTRADGAPFVWPEQAALYERQHSLVSRKISKVFKKALGKDSVHGVREHGRAKSSLLDFHSLRTTWITEALSHGVPIETVKLISGHKTVEVVTEHYFHPNQEHVRNALQGALPASLTGATAVAGVPAPRNEREGRMAAILEKMTAKTWRVDRAALLVILAG